VAPAIAIAATALTSTRLLSLQVADILMYATNQSNPSGAGFVHRVGPSLGKDS
jgi:hypothetical protein